VRGRCRRGARFTLGEYRVPLGNRVPYIESGSYPCTGGLRPASAAASLAATTAGVSGMLIGPVGGGRVRIWEWMVSDSKGDIDTLSGKVISTSISSVRWWVVLNEG
jgi:hypothetical protein